ncbi:MAG: acetyltransferase [Gammaproteobacteria bacterium]|nr:MAG: acetyltransferase [Gammaproteobacteria bacterium]
MRETIFLIHGIFFHGRMMCYMENRLNQCGYRVCTFSYPTVRRSLLENARSLIQFVELNRDTDGVNHFVGHSLGGLLIRRAYHLEPDNFSGRIVTLGTPHNGSLVARRVAHDIHKAILGGAYDDGLDGELPVWPGRVELGSIAGNQCIGIGMALKALEKPNDGTVAVNETQLQHQTDHIQLPLSHTALIYSKRAVVQTNYFLKNGRFNPSVVA